MGTVVAAVSAVLSVGVAPASATHTTVTAVNGSAFGYWADNISLFDGAQADTGPTPSVALAPDASNSPQTATAPCGQVVYGPAVLFTSDAISVETKGSLGTTGSVNTTSSITNINKKTSTACPEATGSEIFTADQLSGSATASEAGASGSTTVTGGIVDTHSNSFNCTDPFGAGCGGHTHTADDPLTPLDESLGQVTVPTNPPVNYAIEGHVHLCDSGPGCIDYFVITFNEHIANPEGSITVNPVHTYYGATLEPNPTGAYVGSDSNRYDIVPDKPYSEGGSVLHGHLYLGQVVAGVTAASGSNTSPVVDFDGDGDSDRSVFRKGAWYVHGQPTAFLGAAGDIPVPGDYNGDGKVDRAVYRNGAWYVAGQSTVYLGNSTDIPVPADYDGDGKVDRAVYRNGAWYVQGQPTVYMGAAGDIPVPGDYNGDGKVDRAVYRNGAWYVHGQPTVYLGNSTDIPVPGDYNGDGSTDRGIYRRSVGGWYIQGQPNVFLGLSSDVPVPGDYDGNASTDRAIWRPSVGGWYVQGQPTVFLGVKGDIPLPLPQAIYRVFF